MLTSVARTEVVAALTAVAVLAPETVAFAQIAGVPPAWAARRRRYGWS
jgi:MFS superfamily sulfate permease-like transporter